MSFLLDPNVVSEWVKPQPDASVVAWLAQVDEDHVFPSVITLAELRHGIQRMATSSRRDRLDRWLRDELPIRFEGRILPVDGNVADAWGTVMARAQAAGRPLGVMDGFIAATAEVHSLTIVSRNAPDFQALGRSILNPWTRP